MSQEIQVAVYAPVSGAFSYRSPEDLAPGVRVLVPFGSRKLIGVVMHHESADSDVKLKDIIKVLDEGPIYSPVLLDLAKWLSAYYMHPVGEVLKAMLPASSQNIKKQNYILTPPGIFASQQDNEEGQRLHKIFGKKKVLAKVTLNKKLKGIGLESESVKKWIKEGLVCLSESQEVRSRPIDDMEKQYVTELETEVAKADDKLALTENQAKAFAELQIALRNKEDPKPILLHGVTGSGKTELYMQSIAELIERDPSAQVLVMVPEISLTPQMTHTFTRRFPGEVAVVHSAMSTNTRWEQLQRIRHERARILIGPRSAIFAPFKYLKLIIIDEEHDGSYKQGSGLLYHARDVAIVRAKMEQAAVLLGSATPSLESYHNARTGKYVLVELLERVEGRMLPHITTLAVKPGHKFGQKILNSNFSQADQVPIDDEIVLKLQENYARGGQSIVIVNRRGYSYYIYSSKDRQAIRCPNCAISLTLHRDKRQARCHYCDYKADLDEILAERTGDELLAVGYGSEKVEGFLSEKITGARIVRLDSDVASQREELTRIIQQFREGEINILVGTQILAKGHDFAKVTMIVLLELDQCLNFPDFRSGEKTFQLVVQAAGRAGRADQAGEVYLQTANSQHPVIQFALQHDYKTFADAELTMRQSMGYPPFTRMAMIEISSAHRRTLDDYSAMIGKWVDQFMATYGMEDLSVLGPTLPPIELIRKRYRRTLIVSSAKTSVVKSLLTAFQNRFAKAPKDLSIKIDVDPFNLI